MKQSLQCKKRVMFNIYNSLTSTMAKGKTLEDPTKDGTVRKTCISGIKPFLYKAEERDKDAPLQVIKITEGRNKVDNKMSILQGANTGLCTPITEVHERSHVFDPNLQK